MSFVLVHQSKKNNAGDANTFTATKCPSHHHHINDLNGNSVRYAYHAQRAFDNQQVQTVMHSNKKAFDIAKIGILQPKLRVSQPQDEYEQEADRVADSILKMPIHESPDLLENNIGVEQVNRKCAACEMKEDEERNNLNISRKQSINTNLEVSDEATNEINSARSGGGVSLNADTKELME